MAAMTCNVWYEPSGALWCPDLNPWVYCFVSVHDCWMWLLWCVRSLCHHTNGSYGIECCTNWDHGRVDGYYGRLPSPLQDAVQTGGLHRIWPVAPGSPCDSVGGPVGASSPGLQARSRAPDRSSFIVCHVNVPVVSHFWPFVHMYISVESNLLYFLSTILLSGVIPARLPRQIIIIGSHPGTPTSSDYYYRESSQHVYLVRLLLSGIIPACLPQQHILLGVIPTVSNYDLMMAGVIPTVSNYDLMMAGVIPTVSNHDLMMAGVIPTVSNYDLMMAGVIPTVSNYDLMMAGVILYFLIHVASTCHGCDPV